MKHTDLLKIIVIIEGAYYACDVSIAQTPRVLDQLERRTRRETTKIVGRKLSHAELTDTVSRMAGVYARKLDEGGLVVAAVWMAVRGVHSTIRMSDLVAGKTLIVSTDDLDVESPSWTCRLSGARLNVFSQTRAEMVVH
jgi:hypothetical protein